MIRAFDLRDLTLVLRLREVGLPLHVESELTDSRHSLRSALAAMFMGGSYPTYIWKSEDGNESKSAFVQTHIRKHFTHAQLIYLGVAGDGDDDKVWLSLLDQLCVEIGKLGQHGLVAEVDEAASELMLFKQAGFAIYTRQDVWVLRGWEKKVGRKSPQLRLYEKKDEWGMHLLYANTVPRLIQMVEPVQILSEGEGWVWLENDDIVAFVHLTRGNGGSWLRFYLHPEAHVAVGELLTAVLDQQTISEQQPIYCCVRRYQSWVQTHLEGLGFDLLGSQAVMVKHIVQHNKIEVREKLAPIDPTTVPNSSTTLTIDPKGK